MVTLDGRLVASTQRPTSAEIDVFEVFDEVRLEPLEGQPEVELGRALACSSAGGGLRMVVVGLEPELTVEAARQAALSAGARVTTVVDGGLRELTEAHDLLCQSPDIILLVGGTDGGDETTLRETAMTLARIDSGQVPVVVAGNHRVQTEAAEALRAGGWPVETAPNVMPAIGTMSPGGVREVVRELFISHVIGGKLVGTGERLVRMATPDAVLRGTELLAQVLTEQGRAGGVIAVDVGGATTDVHSVLVGDHEPTGYKRTLLPQGGSARTVEADLGIRWNAVGVLDAARAEGLLWDEEAAELMAAAEARVNCPAFLPESGRDVEIDRRLATLAITIALRRHAGRRRFTLTPDGAVVRREGRDLTEVSVVLGTGGVLGRLTAVDLERCAVAAQDDRDPRLLPRQARGAIDHSYVLAAVGLLAGVDEAAARALLGHELSSELAIAHEPRQEPE
jgi:uncharacterized protein (TIGR01319 family)